MSGLKTPVFIYHGFYADERALLRAPVEERRYHLSRETLSAHLDILREHRLDALSFQEWVATEGRRPGVLLTFDDAHHSNYDLVWPMLAEKGYRATFFVVADWLQKQGHMTAPQVREVHGAGITIGSHSLTHAFLSRLSRTDLDNELQRSKAVLEDVVGSSVEVLSLPGGQMSPLVSERAAAAAGYRYICTSRPGWGKAGFLVDRLSVTSATQEAVFAALAQGDGREMRKARLKYQAVHAAKRLVGIAGYEWLYRRFGTPKTAGTVFPS